jgi:hypothetical protein
VPQQRVRRSAEMFCGSSQHDTFTGVGVLTMTRRGITALRQVCADLVTAEMA